MYCHGIVTGPLVFCQAALNVDQLARFIHRRHSRSMRPSLAVQFGCISAQARSLNSPSGLVEAP
jgi:hypothetical protein